LYRYESESSSLSLLNHELSLNIFFKNGRFVVMLLMLTSKTCEVHFWSISVNGLKSKMDISGFGIKLFYTVRLKVDLLVDKKREIIGPISSDCLKLP